jgi:hypothetical protein
MTIINSNSNASPIYLAGIVKITIWYEIVIAIDKFLLFKCIIRSSCNATNLFDLEACIFFRIPY